MSEEPPDCDWSLTTWEGNRRAQLRQWCKLSLRERFEALDAMHELAETFARARAEGRFRPAADVNGRSQR